MYYKAYESVMIQIRHLLILLLVVIIQFFSMPRANAQSMAEFRIVSTYDSKGKKCETDKGIPRIFVIFTDFLGTPQASITTYNFMANMWNNDALLFNYCGNNNGWGIYRCDVFLCGTSWFYLYKDGQTVRLKYSFMNGKYNEYTKYVEGSDVDLGPTY